MIFFFAVGLFNSNTAFSQSCANYAVTRTTGITYTTIVGTGTSNFTWRNTASNQNDDNRSYAVPIGFDFWYLGVRYTSISAQLNGTVDFSSSASDGNLPSGSGPYGSNWSNQFSSGGSNGTMLALAPLYGDMWTAGGGTTAIATSLVYKLSGTAPNRVLTVEWINFDEWNSPNNLPPASLNFQVKIYETTGVIEFVYGTMTAGASGGGSYPMQYSCGINNTWSSGSANAVRLLTQQTANTTTFSFTAKNNLSTLPASNSKLTFTPPSPTAAPTGLTFSSITKNGMTLNWTNNVTNEVGYVIYNSTDGVNFNFVTQVAANSTSAAIAGLLSGTTYYWQVYAVTEGKLSIALTGSRATLPAGTITSGSMGGNWSNPLTWDCLCVPTAGDNVIIANSTTVTLDMNGACNSLTVGQGASGQLTIGNNTSPRTLNVNTDVTVNAGAAITIGNFSATHTMTVSGNLINNGTFNLAPTSNHVCNITFNNNGNQTISGTGATTKFNRITLDMGTSNTNVLDITSTNFTVLPANFLTLSNGTFKLSTATTTLTPFTSSATIPLSAGIWINNAGATMSTTGGTITLYGEVRATAGNLNIGNGSNQNLISYGGTIIIDGGAVNIAGSLDKAGPTILTNFTISSGTLTVASVGSTAAGVAPFQMDETGSTFNMSGGTIIIERPGAGNLGYVNTGGTIGTVTGGTLQIGDASTPALKTMYINSSVPVYNLVVSNGTAVTAMLSTNLTVQNNVIINSGTLNANIQDIILGGNWTNNGTFTASTGTVIFNGTSAQIIGGAGNTTFENLTLSSSQTRTIANGVTMVVNGTLAWTAGNLSVGSSAASTLTIANSLTIPASYSLTAVSSSAINIAGNWINNGTFTPGSGTVTFNGTSLSTISGTQKTTFNNLALNNSNGLTFLQNVDLLNTFSFGVNNSTLTTNDLFTIKSSATNTGNIADITNYGSNSGNNIVGKATVERYISARKGWRFLSIPTNTTQTIQQAWQEGATSSSSNPFPGYGIELSGSGGTAAGFDLYSSLPSVKTYNPVTNAWVGVANTNTAGIKATDGYMVFIRGDRTVTSPFAAPTQTVLRTKGNLYVGDQTPVTVNAGQMTSIGNPYPSALDMRNITKTGVKDFFYLWDPALAGTNGYGAYQTFSNNGSGNYVVTPGGGSYGSVGSISNYISSGQAFFVQGDVGGGSLTLKEGAKTTASGVASIAQGMPLPQLRATLYGVNADNSAYITDGLLINYDDSYSNAVDDMDAIKSINTSENLSVKTAGNLLVVERRHTITDKDTIFLNLTGVSARKYRFEFMADQLYQPGLTAFLQDNYLNSSTPLSIDGTTDIDFTVTGTAGSYAANRFMIVFSQSGTLPVTFTSVTAYRKDKNINVEWKADNEFNIKQYEVEKSGDGNQFTTISTLPPTANGGRSASYQLTDTHPVEGYNYYRIKSMDDNGKTAYSNVVKVMPVSVQQDITIYPNPVKNGIINLHFNNRPAGKYSIRLFNSAGQIIMLQQITFAGGTYVETIPLSKYTPEGIYQLEVSTPEGKKIQLNLVN